MPETNSLPTETLAREPTRIMAIPGGIRGVIMAEAAVTTEEKALDMPFLRISGTSIRASMAASARLEPDRPPIRVDSSTLTWARPPCIRPVSTSHRFMMRRATPEEFMNTPAATKKGTARRDRLCTPEDRRWVRIMALMSGFRKK